MSLCFTQRIHFIIITVCEFRSVYCSSMTDIIKLFSLQLIKPTHLNGTEKLYI